jgi:hypothetical protein
MKSAKDFVRSDGYHNVGEKVHPLKRGFHRLAKRTLKKVAQLLGLADGTYTIRTNYAGPAVMGDTTLHGEDIYIHITDPMWNDGTGAVLYRECNGRKDFGGVHSRNNFLSIDAVDDPRVIADAMAGILTRKKRDAATAASA